MGVRLADPAVIAAMDRVHYSVAPMFVGQVAAEITKDRAKPGGLRSVRTASTNPAALEQMGLGVIPSVGNFVLVDVSPRKGADVFEALLNRGLIVRAMDEYGFPRVSA